MDSYLKIFTSVPIEGVANFLVDIVVLGAGNQIHLSVPNPEMLLTALITYISHLNFSLPPFTFGRYLTYGNQMKNYPE